MCSRDGRGACAEDWAQSRSGVQGERSEPFCFDNRNFAESLAKVDGTLTRTETRASDAFPVMPCRKFAIAWVSSELSSSNKVDEDEDEKVTGCIQHHLVANLEITTWRGTPRKKKQSDG